MADMNTWWAGLTIAQKERIATKANAKPVQYPACSTWWEQQSQERKVAIHDHCTDKHGYLLKEWQEGNMYSE
ncbi:MAG: hypothetical protein HUK11_10050 [Muribaculaceae bacterium]|nr:hypothetical protein [Muribaculaceae bacterium]